MIDNVRWRKAAIEPKWIFGLSCSNRHFENEQGYETYKAWKNERDVMPGVADKAIELSDPHTPS